MPLFQDLLPHWSRIVALDDRDLPPESESQVTAHSEQ